jgi:hypothetical protein
MKSSLAQIDVVIAIVSFAAFFTVAEYTAFSGAVSARNAALHLEANLYRTAEVQNLIYYSYREGIGQAEMGAMAQEIDSSISVSSGYGQEYGSGRMVAAGNGIYVIGGVQ